MKQKLSNQFLVSIIMIILSSCSNTNVSSQVKTTQEDDSIEYYRDLIAKDINSVDVSLMNTKACTFEYLTFENGQLILSCKYNEQFMHYDSLYNRQDALKTNYMNSILSGTNTRKNFANYLIKGKTNFTIKVSTTKNDSSFNIIISPEEIEIITSNDKNPKERAQKFLASNAAIANAQCPCQIDECTIFLGMDYNRIQLLNRYQLLENPDFDLRIPEVFQNVSQNMRLNLIANFKTENVAMRNSYKNLLESCVNGESTITYRYTGNKSKKTIDISFSISEIEDILKFFD